MEFGAVNYLIIGYWFAILFYERRVNGFVLLFGFGYESA